MNRTKRGLLIAAIVLNFLYAGLNIYFIVKDFIYYKPEAIYILSIVYDFIGVAGFLISAGLLIYAISNGGTQFRSRNSYYLAAVTISFFLPYSLSTILLIISLFISDIVWVKPIDDVYFGDTDVNANKKEEDVVSDKERERKIAKLRELRDNGTITEEEFKDELMKLL